MIAADNKPRALWVFVIGLFILRWWLGTLPGYPHDLGAYKHWALWGGTKGVHRIYEEGSWYDYPPLYGILLAPIGYVVAKVDPAYAEAYLARGTGAPVPYSASFSLAVKIPPLIFDVLMAILIAYLVRRGGLWGRRRSLLGWAPALIYLLHPAVLFLSGYWGQPDAIETFFIMAALTLILMRRPELGWMAAALGLLMKPIAAPFFPLLAWATLLRSGWKRLLTGGIAGIAFGLCWFLPFILTGRGSTALTRLVTDVDLMPFTSINAHNLWWLLGSWQRADVPYLGPITATQLGLGLFGLVYLTTLWLLWRVERHRPASSASGWAALRDQPAWYAGAAVIAFAFFTLSTHMHENHLFPALPFMILLAGRGRRWAYLTGAAGLAILINMALHDLILGDLYFAKIGGPSSFMHPDLRRPLSRFELGVAYANASLTVAVFVAFLASFIRMLRVNPASGERAC